MIQLGKQQDLKVLRTTSIGVYLGEERDPLEIFARKSSGNKASMTDVTDILLPKNEIKKPLKVGDRVRAFIYKDSEDRPIATLKFPSLQIGTFAVLKVKNVSNIGAFLDWGLPKDLLLPFREQTCELHDGDDVLVTLYVDKSKRLAASMKLYKHLHADSPYKKDDWVSGTVYEISDNFGAFVAVDNLYSALIPKKELNPNIHVNDKVKVRVVRVTEEGRLELSLRDHAYVQIDKDCELVLKHLASNGGFLPYHDKTEPEIIKRELNMSKNAFKRAIGHLMKQHKITISESGITRL